MLICTASSPISLATAEYDTALALAEMLLKWSERFGARLHRVRALNSIAEVRRSLGDLDGAEQTYRETYTLLVTLGSAGADACRLNLGLVLLLRGDTPGASAVLTDLPPKFPAKSFLKLVTVAGLLACYARAGDLLHYDSYYHSLSTLIEETAMVDQDLATCIQLAGEALVSAGRKRRALGAFLLARAHWGGLGNHDRARQADESIRLLTQ